MPNLIWKLYKLCQLKKIVMDLMEVRKIVMELSHGYKVLLKTIDLLLILTVLKVP